MSNDPETHLQDACFDLARTTMWAQGPIDLDAISGVAHQYFEFAKSNVSEGLNIDFALITRAVHYLTQVHAMPMGDIRWFREMLSAILEVARPNGAPSGKGREFLCDMLDGISKSLRSE